MKKILPQYLAYPLFLLLLIPASIQAKHIIGGVMTYECLGEGLYEFTLRVYRDDNCFDCAEFDPIASIGIYRCNNCNPESQNNPFMTINTPLVSSGVVENPDYPCLIPPNVVVEEGLYVFTAELPLSDQSYHISYQRCCRNVTISNIVFPDDQGATYTNEITPFAQQECNSSPVFNEFPPTIICAGESLNFDHSATDPDGDQLVYSFCAPFDGGGNDTSGPGYEECTGAQPTPACPPPYSPIPFVAPNYTFDEPMGGNPIVSIDPNTGLITGTPNIIGQFVVGVCVEEYRNGVLIGTVFRDFQFNVAPCDPTVVAEVGSDEIINGQEYLVVSCGDLSVTFDNQSFQEQFINTYEWTFEIEGQTESSSLWEPTFNFPDTGMYAGQLILNPNTICGDTADILVQIYPEINADFSYEYDTCIAGPTVFTDASVSGSGTITDWNWSFGDGNTSSEQNPVHTYMTPGDIPVTLTVTDINDCRASDTQILPYYPVPNLLIISPSTFEGCQPAEIFFDNLSSPISDAYDILWEFGDGGTGTAVSPTYVYEEPGVYTVSIDVVSPIGCQTDTTFENLISVLPSPTAGFSYTPDQLSNLKPEISIFDESMDASRWIYDFGTGAPPATIPSPAYTFPDTGQYLVQQVVFHPSGCTDTLIQLIDVIPEIRYYLPNAFTPNQDGTNEFYRGAGVIDGATGFQMSIWNRWGEMVFETSDPLEGWNGRKFNSGRMVPNGVYMVLVTFTGPRGKPYEFQGAATVVR
jgi:gliding motility-associated-like protein